MAPESTAPHAPPGPERDSKGRWQPGGASPCPGGLSKKHREVRSAFVERVPKALELVDEWLASKDFEQQKVGVETTLLRALGKPAKSSELPPLDAAPSVAPEQADTGAMLVEVRHMLARGLSVLKSQQEAGELGPDGLEALGRLGMTLGGLVKAEVEAARASKLSALSVDELVDLIPLEVLEAAVTKRKAGV
jgi:hypothetical protein